MDGGSEFLRKAMYTYKISNHGMDLMDDPEKRQSVRTLKKRKIQYWTDGSIPEHATITDINQHGIFINTSNPLDPGTTLSFSFRLTDDPLSKPVEGNGVVTWSERELGMGVRDSLDQTIRVARAPWRGAIGPFQLKPGKTVTKLRKL